VGSRPIKASSSQRRLSVALRANLRGQQSSPCRFISVATLREQMRQVAAVLRYLRPEYLEEIFESYEVEEV